MTRMRCETWANWMGCGRALVLVGAAWWGLAPGVARAQLSPSEPDGVRSSWQFWSPNEEADADVGAAPSVPTAPAPSASPPPATATPRVAAPRAAPPRPARTTAAPVAAPVATAPAARTPVVIPAGDENVEYVFDEEAGNPLLNFLQDRVEIGTRFTAFSLQDDSRPPDPTRERTYVGDINRLEDDQNLAPVKLFADVYLSPYFGVELTYDEVAARTFNWVNNSSDGYLEMSGPIVSLIGRYPIQDVVFPYVGLGYAWMNSSFDREPWWEWGWKSEEEYNAAGGQIAPSGVYRYMIVEDDEAVVYTLGVVVRFTDHLAADVMVRSMDISADALFYRTIDGVLSEPDTKRGSFVMDHIAYGLGVRYVF